MQKHESRIKKSLLINNNYNNKKSLKNESRIWSPLRILENVCACTLLVL